MKKIILLLLLVAQASFGQIPKPKKNTFVNDFASVLETEEINSLNKKIKSLETDHGVQLAIVLIDEIPSEYDIQEFALLIGRRWKVGTKQRGLVYVAALKQRKQRIEVARGLDATLPTPKCMEILDLMKSSFKKERYAAGLDILVNKIDETLGSSPTTPPVSEPQTVQAPQPNIKQQNVTAPKDKNETLSLIVGFLVVAIPLFLIVRYFINRRKINKMQQFYNSPNNNTSYNVPGNYSNGGNNAPPYNSGGYSNGGYNNGVGHNGNSHGNRRGTNWGGVAAGVLGGAAAGYAARVIQDRLSDDSDNDHNTDPGNGTFSGSDEQRNSYGNWGGGDSGGDSSSYDSGFSDSDSSDSDSSSGATSDW